LRKFVEWVSLSTAAFIESTTGSCRLTPANTIATWSVPNLTATRLPKYKASTWFVGNLKKEMD
jgi:hypothetical protein